MGFLGLDADNVAETTKDKWKPGKDLKTEADCEEALYGFYHQLEPNENFHRQYMVGKSRADIYVKFRSGARVVVELKKDLVKRDEYNRLIGQVYEYLTECDCEVVVVLCGASDPSLVKLTKDAVEFLNNHCDPEARFVHKPF